MLIGIAKIFWDFLLATINSYSTNQWKQYANPLGALLLTGALVHYLSPDDNDANCTTAKIVKIVSGTEATSTTLYANLTVYKATGTVTKLNVPLMYRDSLNESWHFLVHDFNLLPKRLVGTPPSPAPVQTYQVYDPTVPPNPTFTGSYVVQSAGLNGGNCTYIAFENGVLLTSQQVSCNADQVPLNQEFLGTDHGYGVPATDPDPRLIIGTERAITTTGTYQYTRLSMAHDVFMVGGLSARGVEAVITPLSLSFTGTSCTNPLSSASKPVMQAVKVVFGSGNYLTFGLVNGCSGNRYYAMIQTVDNKSTIVGTTSLVNAGSPHTLRIEQQRDVVTTEVGYRAFINSPVHSAIQVQPIWNYSAVGAYRSAQDNYVYCQLFMELKSGAPAMADDHPPPSIRPDLYQWDRGKFSPEAELEMHWLVNVRRTRNNRTSLDQWDRLKVIARDRARDVALRTDAGQIDPRYPHAIPPNAVVPGAGSQTYLSLYVAQYGYPYPKGWHLFEDEVDARGLHNYWENIAENYVSFQYELNYQLPRNKWHFLLDGVIVGTTYLLQGEKGGQNISAGLESHSDPGLIIPKHNYTGLKYKDNAGEWRPWVARDSSTVNSLTCGRYNTDTHWIAGQNTSCA